MKRNASLPTKRGASAGHRREVFFETEGRPALIVEPASGQIQSDGFLRIGSNSPFLATLQGFIRCDLTTSGRPIYCHRHN